MFCNSCAAQNPAGKKFCVKCGMRMHHTAPTGADHTDISYCDKCGHPNAKTSKFCAACSNPFVKDFKVTDEDDYVLAEIHLDHIDFENHKDLSTLTKRLTNQHIIFDMSEVKWIDSTGIGSLITLVHRFSREGRELKFFGMTPKVIGAIKALQAENVLEVYDTLNEVLVSWGLPPI